MSHPLVQTIRAVRRSARSVIWMYGLLWVAAIAVAAALAIGGADYLLRISDTGVRLILSVSLLVAVGLAVWKLLLPGVRRELDDVEIARRIERKFPTLSDRLSSAIQFLHQPEDDLTAGSPILRRSVVVAATEQVERLPVREVVDRRCLRLPVAAALLAVTALIVACLVFPASTWLAARRMAVPWQKLPWPLRNDLELVDVPRRLPAGGDFLARLVDHNGQLPDDAQIFYWFADQTEGEVKGRPMQPGPGDHSLRHRLAKVGQSFRVRATGGDNHDMAWIDVEVIEPPTIESLAIRLHPPAYTGLPVAESPRHIRALEGTRVQLAGRSSKPIRAARLVVDAGEATHTFAAQLSEDRRAFTFAAEGDDAWIIQQSGAYAIELLDPQTPDATAAAPPRWEVHALADRPPTISLDRPGTNTYVTPVATVGVRALVKDDLAIAQVRLVYSRSDQSDAGESSLVLYSGPERAGQIESVGLAAGEALGESRTIEHAWDLTTLPSLAPGATVLMHVAASDYRPQSEQSTSRRLIIITPGELQERISQRQTYLLGQLAQVLKLEREARGHSAAITIQLKEVGQLAKPDIDRLQSAELNQRQVERMLTNPHDSIRVQAADLLAELAANRVDDPEVQRRLEGLLAMINRLAAESLPNIQTNLLTSIKAAQATLADRDTRETAAAAEDIGLSLQRAGAGQDEVIAALETALEDLSQWDNYRRFAREVKQLRDEQEQAAAATEAIRLRTLGKEVADLSSQERADLAKHSQQQQGFARLMDKIQNRMLQMQQELADDPLVAQTLGEAVELIQQHAIAGQLREIARSLDRNQVGMAAAQQQQSLEHLSELLDVLANRRENELGRLVKQLRAAGEQLKSLRERQKELRKRIEQAANEADAGQRQKQLERLTRQQAELQQQVENLANKLQRLQAQKAANKLGEAAQKLSRSSEAAQQDNAGQSGQQADLAEQDLEQAQQEIDKAVAQAEQDLAQEQLERLEQLLGSLVRQQEQILADTVRLEELLSKQGELTLGQLGTLRDVALRQRDLIVQVSEMARTLTGAEAFRLALDSARGEMLPAAERLERQITDQQTQQLERQAAVPLRQIVAALGQDDNQDPAADEGGAGEGGEKGQSPTDGIQSLAELKLIKAMQESINARTQELEEARQRKGRLTADQEKDLHRLAEQQGRLAQLVLELVQQAEEPTDIDPQQLPDPRQQPPGLDDPADLPDLDRQLRQSLSPKDEEIP